MPNPKVSIVTTVWNGAEFIRDAVESVLSQTYPDIEYIVKDAGSTDGTLAILAEYAGKIKIISQKDAGIYDGLNQAISQATGEIVAHLNSDDFYASPEAVADMVAKMEEAGADVGWGDIVYVDRRDKEKVVRIYRSSPYASGKFRLGWHPPHTSFFVRRRLYNEFGPFRTDMKIAADYELMLRLLERHHVSSCYLPETMVKMRHGGVSTSLLGRLWKIRQEDEMAWKVNGLKGGKLAAWLLKPLSKIPQLISK